MYSKLWGLWKWGFGCLFGLAAPILEEVAQQSCGSFFEKAAFDEEGMIEAGIGGDVVEGAGVPGFGVWGCVDQTGETACVGGAGAHGAWFQGGVEGAARQAPASRGGGCATDREEFGVGGGISCSLTLVGCYGQDLRSPGDDGSDRDLSPFGCVFRGEQGTAHHGEVGLGSIVCQWRRHEPMIAVYIRKLSLGMKLGWDHTPASSLSIRALISSRTFRYVCRRSS